MWPRIRQFLHVYNIWAMCCVVFLTLLRRDSGYMWNAARESQCKARSEQKKWKCEWVKAWSRGIIYRHSGIKELNDEQRKWLLQSDNLSLSNFPPLVSFLYPPLSSLLHAVSACVCVCVFICVCLCVVCVRERKERGRESLFSYCTVYSRIC